MTAATTTATTTNGNALPALRLDAQGQRHVDLRAVMALAGPLMANCATQIGLNLTDTWYIGRLSANALAGMGAIHWLVVMFIGLLGGVGMATQTMAAQAYGGGRYKHAAQTAWTGMWASLLMLPIFMTLALSGGWLLQPFSLTPAVNSLALAFWEPRMLGAALGVALWAVLGFFNGIGQTRVALIINGFTLALNAVLAPLFIFVFDLGVAGAAWATNLASACGLLLALAWFMRSTLTARYQPWLMWRLRWLHLQRQVALGLPMGLGFAGDMLGFALFQLMLVKLGSAAGAASQVAMMLTSIAFMPGVGLGLAGTTLVGQAIGAGDKAWARRLGNCIILLTITYMGCIGLVLAASGPWLMSLFISAHDVQAAQVIATGTTLLWLAAGYQLFDGMALSASFCLRGAGDARVPALIVVSLSWLVFVPLTHSLAFATGQGWINFLPQYGLGAKGGWIAALVYISLVGIFMGLRWRSGAWERLHLKH